MGQNPKKPVILISRTDKLGDVLLSFPAFFRARELFPGARIIVLVRKYTVDLLYSQHHIDRIICVDDYPKAELVKELQKEKLDYFVALFTNKQIGSLARHSGAKHRIGPLSKLHSWFTYNMGILQKRSQCRKHEYQYNLDLVNKLSKFVLSTNPYTKIFYSDEYRKNAEKYLHDEQIPDTAKIIIINPFTAGSSKNISLDKYLSIGKLLSESEANLWIVYCAIPSNPHSIIRDKLQNRQSLFINEGGIHNYTALMDIAKLYIGPATGTTHIAAFLNKPVIAFYPRIRNQSPKRWGAFGSNRITFIQPDNSCPQKYGCKKTCTHYDCFTTIDINHVAEIALCYLR